MPQTHGRSGTIGRPQSNPRVIHGTMPSSVPPSAPGPMTMCSTSGHEVRRAVEAASHHDHIPADPGAGDTMLALPPPTTTSEPPIEARARELCPAEDDDDVAVDVALDGGRAGNDHHLTDLGARPERVVLADAQQLTASRLQFGLRRLGRRAQRLAGVAVGLRVPAAVRRRCLGRRGQARGKHPQHDDKRHPDSRHGRFVLPKARVGMLCDNSASAREGVLVITAEQDPEAGRKFQRWRDRVDSRRYRGRPQSTGSRRTLRRNHGLEERCRARHGRQFRHRTGRRRDR